MQNIVLDTSIFVQENFLEGRNIKAFLRLSEEYYIQLIVTQIIVDEIKSNFKKRISVLDAEMKNLKKNIENKAILNVNNSFFPEMWKKECLSDFDKKLDDILIKSNVKIIDYTEIDIRTVFDAYFKSLPPFHRAEKKEEFPDAFSLELIKKWCHNTKNKCTLLTTDNDFSSYKNSDISIEKDYQTILDNLLKEKAEKRRIELLNNIYLENSDKIDKALKEWYEEALDDEFLYHDAVNWFGIHNISISEIEILNKTYKIISTDEECIDIEVTANLKFTVIVTIDDQNDGIYDSEDKIMHYFGTTDEIIEQEDEAKLVLSAWIISDEEYDDDVEITEICKDKKIEIDSNYDYW